VCLVERGDGEGEEGGRGGFRCKNDVETLYQGRRGLTCTFASRCKLGALLVLVVAGARVSMLWAWTGSDGEASLAHERGRRLFFCPPPFDASRQHLEILLTLTSAYPQITPQGPPAGAKTHRKGRRSLPPPPRPSSFLLPAAKHARLLHHHQQQQQQQDEWRGREHHPGKQRRQS